jgi:hypothetical protein
MSLNNISKRWVEAVCSLFVFLSAVACSDEYPGDEPIENGKTISVTLDLLVPGLISSENDTRAMGADREKAIDNIQLLIFEKTGTAEVYRHIGEITNSSNTQLTLKMPVGNAQYRFVVLINADDTQVITVGTSKEDVLNNFTFACSGIWNTSGNAAYIPMWGETQGLIRIDNDKEITIPLHRALAKVDIGLNFKSQTQDNQTEEVDGLADFKISSVRVYRTKNKAYVASSSDKINNAGNEVIAPYIPTDATYNLADGTATNDKSVADSHPLVFNLGTPSDKFVREIYIPESIVLPASASSISMDDVPCLVIGGHYKGGEETFYRADFADYVKENKVSKVSSYKEILRNHRYTFNIRSVQSDGFKEPEQALNSITTPMEVSVAAWNEVPLNVYVQGNNFFQVAEREVYLEATYPVYNDKIYQVIGLFIPFKTNIPFIEDGSAPSQGGVVAYKNFKLEWKSTGTAQNDVFQAFINLNDFQVAEGPLIPANTIVIQTSKENIGGMGTPADEITDVLYVTVENFKFTIQVTQKAANVAYDLLCDETIVHGKYREGIPLNYSNYLEVQLSSAEDLFAKQAEFKIWSETRKGIQFAFEGKLEEQGVLQNGTYLYTVKLQGSGTPVKDLKDPLNPDETDGILTRIDHLRINTNSITNSSCSNTSIIFGYKTKRILAIGANAIYRYGYMLEPNTGSRAFVDASINFGVDPHSTVTVEQFPSDYKHAGNYPNKTDAAAIGNAFHIEYMTAGRGMSGERIDVDYLNTMLTEFKPDIILTGQAIYFSDAAIAAISKFVDAGGVLLMFNEYYPNAESINKMASAIVGTTLTGANEPMTQNQFAFTLPTGSQYEEDIILNGAFADLRGEQWGADGYFMHGFGGLPNNDIIIYNTRKGDGKPCFFRHKVKPFVFVGDGGFISNAQRYIGQTYQGVSDYCPFAINSAYQPIKRINYTTSVVSVSNSELFGNILAWAVDYAEFHGINH